jgi:hypothetical protein
MLTGSPYVILEGVDVSKRRVLHTCDGAAIVYELADVGAAVPHLFKPGPCHPSQFVSRLREPGVDRGVPMDRTAQPKEFGWLPQSNPSDLKLAWPPRPITRWSCTASDSAFAALTISRVIAMSVLEGVG